MEGGWDLDFPEDDFIDDLLGYEPHKNEIGEPDAASIDEGIW